MINLKPDFSFAKTPVEPADIEFEGYNLFAQKRYAEAFCLFESLAAAIPNDRRGHAGLAITAEQQWRWSKAIQHWDHCLAISKSVVDLQATARKAHCLTQIGSVEKAEALFGSIGDEFEGLEGLAQIATIQNAQPIAAKLWDKCILRFPDQISGFLGKARLLLSQEAYSEADALLSHIVLVWPESPEAAALWAQCALNAKKWDDAEARWETIMARRLVHRTIHIGYARYLAARGAPSVADAYIEILDDRPNARCEFLISYYLAGTDYGEAIKHAHDLVKLEPEVPWQQVQLASIFMLHGSTEKLWSALEILRSLFESSPDSIEVKLLLITALIQARINQTAKDLIRTIPGGERRVEIEVLRAWREYQLSNETVAKERWNGILNRQYFSAVHARIDNLARIDNNDAAVKKGDVLLFSFMRNEESKLEWFLNHYRKLGVDKFIIVDNASTDQSSQLLLDNRDIILYHTTDRYSMAGDGMRWINELISRYGRKNWCLYIDADEALVYPDCETSDLHELTNLLDHNGDEAMSALMLDMYPESVASISDAARSWQSSYVFFDNYFQSFGYPICPYRETRGGVRRRLFQGYQLLTKVPMINGAADIKFLLSCHRITPAKVSNISAALLHYHLVYLLQPEYQTLFHQAIESREYPNNALERVRSLELLPGILAKRPLLCEESVKFQTSEQLSDLGIITSAAR